jgi:hypothetical protein
MSALAIVLLGIVPTASNADEIYTYTGPNYDIVSNSVPGVTYTTSMDLTITLDMSAPLGADLGSASSLVAVTPVSISLSDGLNTVTFFGSSNNSSETYDEISLSTDGSGNIADWNVSVGWGNGPGFLCTGPSIDTCSISSVNDQTSQMDFAQVFCNGPCDGQLLSTTSFGTYIPLEGTNTGLWATSAPVSVPEPSPLGLMGGALLALGFVKRRKHTKLRRA